MTREWRENAACKTAPVGLFDPPEPNETKSDITLQLQYARHYCGRCPVADLCFKDGDGQPGIWGGKLRTTTGAANGKGRPIAACGTDTAKRRHRALREKCTTCTPPVPSQSEIAKHFAEETEAETVRMRAIAREAGFIR